MTIFSSKHCVLAAAVLTACGCLNAQSEPARPDSATVAERHQSVGLVLSGGGAKGIAHIGVIKALEENDIPIDYIAGTSMGAIIGGLYAAGYTTDEMMQLLKSRDFSYWSTGKIDPTRVYYFNRQEPTPTLFTLPLSKKDSTANSVPASLISPLPMNFAFMDLFAAYTAQCGGNFDRLFVPFRCVASDVENSRKVVLGKGSLGDAIRTSMSFPIVFQPIEIDGKLMYDGGIYDNFPVDVMTNTFAPDFIIGIDVSALTSSSQNSLMDQIENLVMQKQSYIVPSDKGMKIHIPVQDFGLLDFPAAERISDIGYKTAMEMMDSLKTRVTTRISPVSRSTQRDVFKSQTPYVHFNQVNVSGGTPRQNRYIKYIFEPAHADTFGIAHVRESYYRAISSGRLRDLFPQAVYNPSDSMFTLNLKATPRSSMSLGVGGYITSSVNSYLFVSANYKTLSFSSISTDLNAWIGQSYMAGYLQSAINLSTDRPSAVGIDALVSRQRFFETDKLFYNVSSPSFAVNHEYWARLRYSIAAGSKAKVDIGVGYGHLYDSFFRSDAAPSSEIERDHTAGDYGQVRIGLTSSTLDNVNYPTSGHEYVFSASGMLGKYHFRTSDGIVPQYDSKPSWLQAHARTRNYWSLSPHFALGLESDLVYSTRKLTGYYDADIVNAHAFNPTPASYNRFNSSLRANSYVALGIVPVYKHPSGVTARLAAHTFVPMRDILPIAPTAGMPLFASKYGGWFNTARFYGQLNLSYDLPINATISGYVSYVSAGSKPWSVGINIGLFILPPKFLN